MLESGEEKSLHKIRHFYYLDRSNTIPYWLVNFMVRVIHTRCPAGKSHRTSTYFRQSLMRTSFRIGAFSRSRTSQEYKSTQYRDDDDRSNRIMSVPRKPRSSHSLKSLSLYRMRHAPAVSHLLPTRLGVAAKFLWSAVRVVCPKKSRGK